ncbi:hypothetical protein JCM10207_005970 [Rhodosporidiobolus poonsookiae]
MSTPSTSAASAPPRVKRSQFIDRLHDLLENPADADSLRWTPDGQAFEITTNEAKARAALSPKWDFRSLSSFIRQLSYYNFKRLSDRRRSVERKASVGYIVFSHPSGVFIRGDNSQLDNIIRKSRARPEKQRRASGASTGSADDSPASPTWGPSDLQYHPPITPSFAGDNPFQPYPAMPGGLSQYQPPPIPSPSYFQPAWPSPFAPQPAYNPAETPPSRAYDGYNEVPEPQYHALRRGSLSDFKVDVSPRTKTEQLHPPPPSSVYRPAYSPLGMGEAGASSAPEFRSPYPTPTYASTTGSTSAFEQPHHHLPATEASASSSYRPNGLPMFNPRGSISTEAGQPASSLPPTYSPYPAPLPPHSTASHPTLPALHLSIPPHVQQHFASQHQQQQHEVLPSPTYSSGGDHSPASSYARRDSVPHLAPLQPTGMPPADAARFGLPYSLGPTQHTAASGATSSAAFLPTPASAYPPPLAHQQQYSYAATGATSSPVMHQPQPLKAGLQDSTASPAWAMALGGGAAPGGWGAPDGAGDGR